VDVFDVRDRLIGDYREFTSSFVDPRDELIRAHVDRLTGSGYQWPAPYLSLNPNFASGGTVDELVAEGLLHPDTERIFRIKGDRTDPGSQPLRLHQHQREAIATARGGGSYVLTTGTGSGKSLSYIVPIVDRVLRAKADGSRASPAEDTKQETSLQRGRRQPATPPQLTRTPEWTQPFFPCKSASGHYSARGYALDKAPVG
jgi:hypothetical protein